VEVAKEASQNFVEAWKRRKHAQVARDEPRVSFGGLLEKHFGNNIHNTKYRRSLQKKKEYLRVSS
jgi:hypothetical protein